MKHRRPNGEGSISQRKDGRWMCTLMVGYTPAGKRKMKSFYGKTQAEAKKKRNEYLRLKDAALQLEEGDRGMLELVLDSRENVLMVPESAVVKTKGKTIVYYQDENGLKVYKTVEIGLTANGMTEIVSGLTEGECVIAG